MAHSAAPCWRTTSTESGSVTGTSVIESQLTSYSRFGLIAVERLGDQEYDSICRRNPREEPGTGVAVRSEA